MKLALDVHSLGARAAGNETYYRQLLRGLLLDRSPNDYTLFYTHAAALECVDPTTDPRFRWVAIPRNPLPRLAFSLPRLLRSAPPDVFHCQYIRPLGVRAKTVVTIHDLAHEHLPALANPLETLAMRKLVRSTARRADRILTVSEFCARDIVSTYGLPQEKVVVAYPAVAEEFRPRDKSAAQEQLARAYGIKPGFLLYVGRIQVRKNLVRLVEAYAQARKQGVSEKLVIVGPRDFGAEQLLARIDQLGLRDSVIFPGYVPADGLPLFFNAAEAFLFPSLFEGFGLPVIESMASGLPTVTSFGSSLEEVAADAALLIDPQDVAALAAAIERILSDSELRESLIARGLRRASQFTVENFAQRVLDVYRSIA
ncbi:MAG TPA: glycosyltransferase family 1 protein [Terriglobales bacterium]|nr:glycosyltransferase family 1 protein [Terriglobales bacterium]